MSEFVDGKHAGAHPEKNVFEESTEDFVALKNHFGQLFEPLVDSLVIDGLVLGISVYIFGDHSENYSEANDSSIQDLRAPDEAVGLLDHNFVLIFSLNFIVLMGKHLMQVEDLLGDGPPRFAHWLDILDDLELVSSSCVAVLFYQGVELHHLVSFLDHSV